MVIVDTQVIVVTAVKEDYLVIVVNSQYILYTMNIMWRGYHLVDIADL